jgi:hypothetical protein
MRGWNHIKSSKLEHTVSKFKAIRTTVGDITFDSKMESECYKVLANSGLENEFQKVFELIPGFIDSNTGEKIRPITYVSDFYISLNGYEYILDAKGVITPDHKIKTKLMRHNGKLVIHVKNTSVMLAVITLIKEGLSPADVYKHVKEGKSKTKKKWMTK